MAETCRECDAEVRCVECGAEEPGYRPVAPLIAARLAPIEAALDDDLTPTLGIADWACDPLPSNPNYASVNPDWLRAMIVEAKAVRAALAASRPVHPAGEPCGCEDGCVPGTTNVCPRCRGRMVVHPAGDTLATRIEALAAELDAAARNRHHEADGAMQAAIAGRLRDALGGRP